MISKISSSVCALALGFAAVAGAAPIFQDVTAASGLPMKGRYSFVAADFDNDGRVDLLTPGALFQNTTQNGRISFREITLEKGLAPYLSDNSYPVVADFNNDGRLDIASTGGFLLIQAADGSFREQAKAMGLEIDPRTHTLSVGDLNRDGWVDLISGIEEKYEKSEFFAPKVYRNNQGRGFQEISKELGWDQHLAYPRGIVWADFDNDRNLDIFFSNYRLRPSFLFKGVGVGQYQERADFYHIKGEYDPERYYDEATKRRWGPMWGHATGSVWADLNNDGNLDLWVSKLVHKYVGPADGGGQDIRGYVCDDSKIFANLGAPTFQFADMRKNSGLPEKPIGGPGKFQGDELWFHTTGSDFDNDGLVDMFVSQVYDLAYAKSFLFRNKGNFQFEDVAASEKISVIGSIAAAWADFDNDGRMDLVTSGRSAQGAADQLRLFRNVLDSGNHYLKIKLIGTKSGKTPITTQVRLFHRSGLFLKQYEGVTGVMGQMNDPTLHFGLGNLTMIPKIEIRWSSGQTQILENIRADQTLTVTEP